MTLPRNEAVSYAADLLGNGAMQQVWENGRVRTVFSQADGGRWIELYWKASGKSLLPPDGVAIGSPVKIALSGAELTLTGTSGLPRGGRIGNVEWSAETAGTVTRYRVRETISGR